jgi:hypothetical protein
MNDYEGALGEGTDTPDKALARKAARLPAESVAKQAGLAATRGVDVGLKRFLMGNIDAPDSEASRRFGADKGVQMAEGAKARPVASVAAPVVSAPAVRQTADRIGMDTTPTPAPVSSETVREMRKTTPANAPQRIVSKAELAKSGKSLRDFLNTERGLKRRPEKSYPKDTGTETFLKKGGSIKAYASGGSVSSRADGCAQRGKTKGMMR